MDDSQYEYVTGKIAALEHLMFMVHKRVFLDHMDEDQRETVIETFSEGVEESDEFDRGWNSVFRMLANRAKEEYEQKKKVEA